MKSYKFHILSLATLLLLGATTHVEAKIFERKKKKAQTEVKAAPVKQNINGLKPYAQVITPKAKSSFGFLTVHKVDNNYFFEIPDSMLNRDILIVNRIRQGSYFSPEISRRLSGRYSRKQSNPFREQRQQAHPCT